MDLDNTTTFTTYLIKCLNASSMNIHEANHKLQHYHIRPLTHYLHDKNAKASDHTLYIFSKIFDKPFTEVYWYNISPYDRQNRNEKAALTVICKIVNLNLANHMPNEQLLARLKVSHNVYYDWRKLRKPINNYYLKHIAHIYSIPSQDLIKLPQQDKLLFNKTPMSTPHNSNTQGQLISHVHTSTSNDNPLVNNLHALIRKHHTYKNLQDLLTTVGVSTTVIYEKRNKNLKYAKRIANYLDMNLEYLLKDKPQSDSQNTLYKRVKQYANQHHITFTDFEKSTHLPFGVIQHSQKSAYLNSLVTLSNHLHVTIDDLLTSPPCENTTVNLTNLPQLGQLKIGLAQPSEPISSSNPSQSEYLANLKKLNSHQTRILNDIVNAWLKK